MSRINKLFLRVREADEADYGKSIVRIHKANKPQGINWGDSINISLDNKHWMTCKLERAGDVGAGKIYIGIHLRGLLNRDTVATQIAQLEVPCDFYIRKASYWKVIFYITIAILLTGAFASLVYFLSLMGC
ncbi:hypothetical protein ACFLVG_04790 [Chloroflexota bacterium]